MRQKIEELNQNVSVNMFEVDDENEQTVISRKLLKKKDAECHTDVLRIDEVDNGHYIFKMLSQTFKLTKKY